MIGLSQPLWLDELHSSWTIADGWTELWDRASRGNQTATYFIGLKCLTWLFGDQDAWIIRLPSVVSWSLALSSMAWMLLQTSNTSGVATQVGKRSNLNTAAAKLAIVLLCVCVLLDPWQYFYAVEGRVYSLIQLLNLWSWFFVSKILANDAVKRLWLWLAWTVLAVAIQNLHITSSLAVAVQGALLLGVQLWAKRDLLYLIASLSIVTINTVWLLFQSQSLWDRRQQWESFAGNGSFDSLIAIFPWGAILLPAIVGGLIYLVVGKLRFRAIASPTQDSIDAAAAQFKLPPVAARFRHVSLWGLAALAPCLIAWLITRYDIAPVFHYRFVVVSALPVYLLAGHLLLCQSNVTIRCLTVLVSLCWMSLSYGPLASAQQGRWLNERTEDWRSAIDFVQQNRTSSSQSLWCYAGLIEAKGVGLPISASMSEYLSFPLRIRWRVQHNSEPFDAQGLVADRRLWLQQIREYHSNFPPPASSSPTSTIECWVIYRGTVERLQADLVSAGSGVISISTPIHSFGNVSVVGLTISP